MDFETKRNHEPSQTSSCSFSNVFQQEHNEKNMNKVINLDSFFKPPQNISFESLPYSQDHEKNTNKLQTTKYSIHTPPENPDFEFSIDEMQEYIFSNSPISLSPNSSDTETEPTTPVIRQKNIDINPDVIPKKYLSSINNKPSRKINKQPYKNSFIRNQNRESHVSTTHLPKKKTSITENTYNNNLIEKEISNSNESINLFLQSNDDIEETATEDKMEHSDFDSSSSSQNKMRKYKKLTYEDVEKTIQKYYAHDKLSNEFDILLTYIRGKKHLYIQSKNLIQTYLTMVNILIIVLTASVAVISPILYDYQWSSYIITGINSLITLLFGLYNYLKLESTVDNFFNISNQYNNLETTIEMTSNKLYFIQGENEKNKIIIEKIEYLEEKLKDINDNFTMIVPELVKQIFPVISHINVFMFIKKIESYKYKLIMDLCNIKNEIRYISYKYNLNQSLLVKVGNENEFVNQNMSSPNKTLNCSFSNENTDFVLRYCNQVKKDSMNTELIRIQKRLQFLLQMKTTIKDKIYHYKNTYGYIDEIFNEEITNAEHISYWYYVYFNFGRNQKNKNEQYQKYTHDNPVIQDILKNTVYHFRG